MVVHRISGIFVDRLRLLCGNHQRVTRTSDDDCVEFFESSEFLIQSVGAHFDCSRSETMAVLLLRMDIHRCLVFPFGS